MDAPTPQDPLPPSLRYPGLASTPRQWPAAFARASLGDFELTPALDAELSALALAARDDPLARDELFVRLAGKVMRFAARFDSWDIAPVEPDDVRQECYLVFLATLAQWTPTDPAAPGGFGAWFLRVFPLRLANAVRRQIGRRYRTQVVLPPGVELRPDPDVDAASIVVALTLGELCGRLDARAGAIVRLRVAGLPTRDVAAAVGVSERAVQRSLLRFARLARPVWDETREAG